MILYVQIYSKTFLGHLSSSWLLKYITQIVITFVFYLQLPPPPGGTAPPPAAAQAPPGGPIRPQTTAPQYAAPPPYAPTAPGAPPVGGPGAPPPPGPGIGFDTFAGKLFVFFVIHTKVHHAPGYLMHHSYPVLESNLTLFQVSCLCFLSYTLKCTMPRGT